MFSLKEIRELIDLVTNRNLGGIEIESAGFRLRIDGPRPASPGLPASPPVRTAGDAAHPAPPQAADQPPPEGPATQDDSVHVITSPIVGTFYRSPSPEADPFAEVGERVAKGRTLCIIESMKLMNEIESDVEGEVVAVYPRNGQPVEYGEKLFAIRLAA
jgi:acetyl-CoA carboxylase biotin carboxyl carrier protein